MNTSEKIRKYIMENIDLTGYPEEGAQTESEKINAVFAIFQREKSWEIQRLGEYEAFADWLHGLPFALHVAFETWEQRRLLEEWLEKPMADFDADAINMAFAYLVRRAFFEMLKETNAC